MTEHHGSTGLFSVGAGGSLTWAFLDFLTHGPEWSQVAPILFGISSVVMAVRAYQNDAAARRLAAESRRAALPPLPLRPTIFPGDPAG